jgi:hypothetical protein
MKYIIAKLLLSILLYCIFLSKTVGQPLNNEYYRAADSLFNVAAQCYYAEHLNNDDVRDLRVSSKGFVSISLSGKSHRCYKVEVVYSIYKDGELYQTHNKSWHWDLVEEKCYWYSDIAEKRKPGDPYRGMLTSVAYIDVTKESFAQRGFEILKKLRYE